MVFLGAIGVYALAFILWCTFFQDENGRGLASFFPNRMRALLSSKSNTHAVASIASRETDTADAMGFECLGWRHTMDCDPMSNVLQSFNRSCDHQVRGGLAGYCALRSRATGLELRSMRATCGSVRPEVLYTCDQALDFVAFKDKVRAVIARAKEQRSLIQPHSHAAVTRGIVMVVYPKLLASAYAVVRTLRESLNCSLPIELWYVASEMGGANATVPNRVLETLAADFAPLSLVPIAATAGVAGFATKVHAIMHTNFSQVLFLDADNIPVKDPTFLFTTPAFQDTGAVFWPDFWHPTHSIFNVNNASLVWELLDLDFVDMFEQESGQILIDKRRSTVALEVLAFFALRRPSVFERLQLVWGDKDLFRLAWLKTGTRFHMVATPPAIAGTLVQSKFCGMTMAQFDPSGQDIVFLHRNAMKLNGGRPVPGKDPDALIWTHLQTFAWQSNTSVKTNATEDDAILSASVVTPTVAYTRLKHFFKVGIFNGAPEFPPTQWCYGREAPPLEAHFRTIPWSETPFAGVEQKVLALARAGAALLPPDPEPEAITTT